jgi:hypothetical protein
VLLWVTTGRSVWRPGLRDCLPLQRVSAPTGSVLGVGAYYKEEQVEIKGRNKVFVRDAPEGRKVRNHFCPECGTPLFWEADRAPGIIGIAVGTFADPDFPPPSISFFEKYRHRWVEFNHNLERFSQRTTSRPLWTKTNP